MSSEGVRMAAWRMAPREVDPLSWFAGPSFPLVLAGVGVLNGLNVTIVHWQEWSNPLLQLIALPLVFLGSYIVFVLTRPHRPAFSPAKAGLSLVVMCLAMIVSALGTAGGSAPLDAWWPAFAVSLYFLGLAPYASARQLIAYSIPLVIVASVIATLVFVPERTFWPPVSTALFAVSAITVAVAATVVFSYTVVSQTLKLQLAKSAADHVPFTTDPVAIGDTATMSRVAARVVPFLQSVVDSGHITESDRGLAAHLARRLRTELVSVASESWLDSLARESGVIVSDPERLADRMNEAQRAAMLGLLAKVAESPIVDSETVLVEIRSAPDGSTAVALSLDLDLPEGRRLTLLAPYYLTLKTTVDSLAWDDGRRLMMTFTVAGDAQLPE